MWTIESSCHFLTLSYSKITNFKIICEMCLWYVPDETKFVNLLFLSFSWSQKRENKSFRVIQVFPWPLIISELRTISSPWLILLSHRVARFSLQISHGKTQYYQQSPNSSNKSIYLTKYKTGHYILLRLIWFFSRPWFFTSGLFFLFIAIFLFVRFC